MKGSLQGSRRGGGDGEERSEGVLQQVSRQQVGHSLHSWAPAGRAVDHLGAMRSPVPTHLLCRQPLHVVPQRLAPKGLGLPIVAMLGKDKHGVILGGQLPHQACGSVMQGRAAGLWLGWEDSRAGVRCRTARGR